MSDCEAGDAVPAVRTVHYGSVPEPAHDSVAPRAPRSTARSTLLRLGVASASVSLLLLAVVNPGFSQRGGDAAVAYPALTEANDVEYCLQTYCNKVVGELRMNSIDPHVRTISNCLEDAKEDKHAASLCLAPPDLDDPYRHEIMAVRVCSLCNGCMTGGHPPKARCDSVVGSYGAAYGATYGTGGTGGGTGQGDMPVGAAGGYGYGGADASGGAGAGNGNIKKQNYGAPPRNNAKYTGAAGGNNYASAYGGGGASGQAGYGSNSYGSNSYGSGNSYGAGVSAGGGAGVGGFFKCWTIWWCPTDNDGDQADAEPTPAPTPWPTPSPTTPPLDPSAFEPAIPEPVPDAVHHKKHDVAPGIVDYTPGEVDENGNAVVSHTLDPVAYEPAIPEPVPDAVTHDGTPGEVSQKHKHSTLDPSASQPAIPEPVPDAVTHDGTPGEVFQKHKHTTEDPAASEPAIPEPVPDAVTHDGTPGQVKGSEKTKGDDAKSDGDADDKKADDSTADSDATSDKSSKKSKSEDDVPPEAASASKDTQAKLSPEANLPVPDPAPVGEPLSDPFDEDKKH